MDNCGNTPENNEGMIDSSSHQVQPEAPPPPSCSASYDCICKQCWPPLVHQSPVNQHTSHLRHFKGSSMSESDNASNLSMETTSDMEQEQQRGKQATLSLPVRRKATIPWDSDDHAWTAADEAYFSSLLHGSPAPSPCRSPSPTSRG